MEKRGDIWVSAILYFGIGIVLITVVLAAGLPVINRLRDKNVVIQTKQVMHTLDENIREVVKEGPGSQRVVTVNIKKGSFIIDEDVDGDNIGENIVKWRYENAKVPISQPNDPNMPPATIVEEGKLNIITYNAAQDKTYDIEIYINYNSLADITKDGTNTLSGLSDLVIINKGPTPSQDKVEISIKEI